MENQFRYFQNTYNLYILYELYIHILPFHCYFLFNVQHYACVGNAIFSTLNLTLLMIFLDQIFWRLACITMYSYLKLLGAVWWYLCALH